MIIKVVKMYSNRQRVDLNKKDGFNAGEEIILMSKSEYDNLKHRLFDLDNKLVTAESENKILKDRNDTITGAIQESKKQLDIELEKLLEVSLKPINETHKKQLADKDHQIKELTDKLNTIQGAFSQFITKINSLNAIDFLFRKKHNQVINDFSNSVWITTGKDKIVNADVKSIAGTKDSAE